MSGCIFNLYIDDLFFSFPDYFGMKWIKINYENGKSFDLAFDSVIFVYCDLWRYKSSFDCFFSLLPRVRTLAGCVFSAQCSPDQSREYYKQSLWLQMISQMSCIWKDLHVACTVTLRQVVCDVHPLYWACWQLLPESERK